MPSIDLGAFRQQAKREAFDADDEKPDARPAATVVAAATTAAPAATLDFGQHAPKRRTTPDAEVSAAAVGFAAADAASEVRASAQATSAARAGAQQAATPESAASVWAELRAQELQAQRVEIEAQERRRADAERAQLIKQQEADWIASRPDGTTLAPTSEAAKALHGLYVAATWERAFASFSRLVETDAIPRDNFAHYAATAASAVGGPLMPPEVAAHALATMEQLAARNRVEAARWRVARLRLLSRADPEKFAQEATHVTPQDLARFPLSAARRVVAGVNHSGGPTAWMSACELVDRAQPLMHDPFGTLELAVLRTMRLADDGPAERNLRAEVANAVERRLRAKLSELGKLHLAVLMDAYGRARRGHDVQRLFQEADQRGDVDELLCSVAVRYSRSERAKHIVAEMKEKGVSVSGTQVTVARMLGLVGWGAIDEAADVYAEYRRKSPDAQPTVPLVNALAKLIARGARTDGLAPTAR